MVLLLLVRNEKALVKINNDLLSLIRHLRPFSDGGQDFLPMDEGE